MQKQVKYTRIVGWCYILYNTNLGKSEVFQHYIDFLAWYCVLFSVFETIILNNNIELSTNRYSQTFKIFIVE